MLPAFFLRDGKGVCVMAAYAGYWIVLALLGAAWIVFRD